MTKAVITCTLKDSLGEVIKVMTQRRIRHLPVKDGQQLVGIITIGDVLKNRLDEMQFEANVLRDYAIARGLRATATFAAQQIKCEWEAANLPSPLLAAMRGQ